MNNLFDVNKIFENNYVLNVNYAFHIHKQLYNITYEPSLFKKFYAVFHECEENQYDYKNFMDKKNENFKDNSQLVGSTKINYLINNKIIKKNKCNKSILFSFRWENDTQNCTYDTYINYFKEEINTRTNINFIYRPHILSKFNDLEKIKTKNFEVDKSIDYTNIFNETTFFISDLSTLMVDFLFYTQKPVILLKGNLEFNEILNSFGEKIIDVFYIANNVNELNDIVNNLLDNNDLKKKLRQNICNHFNKLNINAFYNISEFIKKEFLILNSNKYKKDYWNNFYSINTDSIKIIDLKTPSNFCLFVVNYINKNYINTEQIKIIDIGCGNGRDLIHFKNIYKYTEGLDISIQTINYLKSHGIECYESNMLDFNYNKYDILYSRFSLHTLTHPEVYIFIKNISITMNKNSLFFIETRSISGTKYSKKYDIKLVNFKSSIGENHNRLLISLNFLRNILIENNFVILYETDSNGLAIFREEDPYVLRFICKKK